MMEAAAGGSLSAPSSASPTAFGNRVNLQHFVDANKSRLVPPVSNCMLFSGNHLKVMIVGGPNQRDDFHVERGEEFFYQLSGQMNLDVMQMGRRMRIPIEEGSVFVLPAGVPHSPQRYENTIGLVVERTRSADELDALQWYVPGTNRLLYREVFYCADLGTQLKGVIERFVASEDGQRLTALPSGWRVEDDDTDAHQSLKPYPLTEPEPLIHTPLPTPLPELIAKGWKRGNPYAHLIDSEFVLSVFKGCNKKEAGTYFPIDTPNEVLLLQISGASEISCGPDNTQNLTTLKTGEAMLLHAPEGTDRYQVRKKRDCEMIAIYTKKVLP